MKRETLTVTFDTVKQVKTVSRDTFRNMPKAKRIEDKRNKKPRYGWRAE